MASRPVKLKLLPRTTIKAKSTTRIPARVVGGDGVTVVKDGGVITISADLDGGAFFSGPDHPTHNAIPRLSSVANHITNSGVVIDDDDNISGVANVVAGGIVTGSNLPLPVEIFNVKPGNSAATNSTNLDFAELTAAGQGGRSLVFGPGTFNFSRDFSLQGHRTLTGIAEATVLNFASSKGILTGTYTLCASSFTIITAGTAIQLGDNASNNFFSTIEKVYFYTCGVAIDARNAGVCRILHCAANGFVSAGMQISAPLNPDGGDNLIHDFWFLTNGGFAGGSSNAAILHTSGGGWKIANCKMVGGNRGYWHSADYTGACSSLILSNNSIEGMAEAMMTFSNQSSTVGDLSNVVINGVQGGAATYGIYILPRGSSAWIARAAITGVNCLNLNGATAALYIDGVSNLDVTGGSYGNVGTGTTGIVIGAHCTGQIIIPAMSGYTTRYTNASASVNVVDFGGGLTTTAPVSVLGGFSTIWRATAATDITMPTTGTLATRAGAETLTNKTITGGTHTAITALGIRSTGTGAFDLRFTNTENLTAQRSLVLQLGDADRLLALTGNLATTANFSFLGGFDYIMRTTASTDVTFPTTGTLATRAGSEALTNKTYNGNTWTAGTGTLTLGASKTATVSNTLTFTGTDGSTVAFGAGGTIAAVSYSGSASDLSTGTLATARGGFGASVAAVTGISYFSGGSASFFDPTPVTSSLGADVAVNNTANYFDGPSIAQGSTGTWFVSGKVTVLDSVGAATFFAKLWDGTTVIDSGAYTTGGANFNGSFALSGYITAPTGNLRISVRDISSNSGVIKFNQTGNSKDSTITAYRVK